MLNLGMTELLVFAIIAVIVLGPDKLPTAVRSVIKWYRQVKMLISNVQRDIERELDITEIREKMEQEIARFKEIEQHMQAQLNQIQKEVDQQHKEIEKAVSPVAVHAESQMLVNHETATLTTDTATQIEPQQLSKPISPQQEKHTVPEHALQQDPKKVVAV
ncbi:Sec-independent protein translocase protein TatB [Acinetobacter sp. NIPH 2699]|uniref:Sec-independent protein translocase protein TatB n=1 Tax=Acinetobacter sp. NIPH 2699 TaxID=2923433 RepID=UPI001F4C309C|nr:Sec-independent protein translocase protein TatB [Acinetobacter sp. NIPH 2699]MCH7337749.1 Sec-independent protein translocase protein TatB [Acinetobacter sp. NIPH 2699]